MGNALGTTYAITFIATEELDFQTAIDSVFQAINQSMSTYIPDSDISKINAGDTTVVVDKLFQDVYFQSQVIHIETDGYFDPTVGVLVDAWGFGPGESIKLDSTKVDSLMQYVGFDKVGITADYKIVKTNPKIKFDFNAIAKGYAIDCLGRMLNAQKIQNYLIEVGGEVVTKGINLISEKEWTVGVDDPTDLSKRGSAAILRLKNKALASSGNYRKFWVDEKTGEKYVHTINPKTGFTRNSNVLATTVVADQCIQADAYATAFMAMNLDETISMLAQKKELEALIIYLDEEGVACEFATPGFQKLVVQ